MSLRYKILFGIIAVYALTLGILAVLLSFDLDRRERAASDQRREEILQTNRYVSVLLKELVETYLKRFDRISIRDLLEWPEWSRLRDPVLLTTEQGEETFINPLGARRRLGNPDTSVIRADVEEAIRENRILFKGGFVAAPLDVQGEGETTWGLHCRVPIPASESFRPLVDVRMVFILMVIGIPLITLVTYGLLSRLVFRPIEMLREANRRVAKGDYASELPRSARRDEIEELIGSFNSMLRDVRDYHENLEQKVREATEKIRRTEQRLITAQRLAATGKLAAGIAHEINNPLGGMINITRNLRHREYEAGKREEYLELILSGLERIQATVRKMLPLSIHKVQPQVVDLRKALAQVLELVRFQTGGKGIRLSMELPPGEFSVFGDPHELHQVYLNLVMNAVDAIGKEGEIRVRGRLEPPWVVTWIEDTGCGMTEAQISEAFDLFYTTKGGAEGSGLGLSIVHNIVDNHGGAVSIRSRPGEGTSVEVRLPLAAR